MVLIKNNTRILKLANKYLVLQCISTYEPITIENIVKKTNLSRPTVINSVRELTEENVVMKEGYAESTGGRIAALLVTNADAYYAVGVDFEFPQVRLAIANLKGVILTAQQFKYRLDIPFEEIIDDLPVRIDSFIHKANVDIKKIKGLGMGLPGIVDTKNGRSKFIERINGWKDVDIQNILERKLVDIPVYIRNDVHLLALVEKRYYLRDMERDFIYIGLRSGVGSAVFIKNAIYEGINGNAGFIGHMILDTHGSEGFGGPKGCLNVYAGELSLIKKYVEEKQAWDNKSSIEKKDIKLENLVELSKNGDQIATDILKEAGYYIGVAIANLVRIFEIPNIIIGGCPNIKDSVFIQMIENTTVANLRFYFDGVVITPGQLSEQDYSLGGCFLVFDHIFHKPKLKLQI